MKYLFEVPDMSCNHCKMTIEKHLKESGLANNFKVDLEQKKVEVETTESIEKIEKLLEEIGYPPTLIK